MNKFLPMALLCLFLFSNCKKENLSNTDKKKALAPGQKEGEELLLRVKEKEGAWNLTIKYIVTDTAGNLLGEKEYQHQGEETLEIFGKLNKSHLVNVYRIELTLGMDLEPVTTFINAFLGTKKGSTWNRLPQPFVQYPAWSTFKIKLKNIPSNYQSIYISSGQYSFSQYASKDTTELNRTDFYYVEGSKILVRVKDNSDEELYNLFPIEPVNGILAIDVSKCDKRFTKKSYTLPEFVEPGWVDFRGSIMKGFDSYDLGYSYRTTRIDEIEASYPELKPFKDFSTEYFARQHLDGKSFVDYFGTYKNIIPEKLELLDFNIAKIKRVNDSLQIIDIIGNAQYYFAYFQNYNWYKHESPPKNPIYFNVIAPPFMKNIRILDFSGYIKGYSKKSIQADQVRAYLDDCNATVFEKFTNPKFRNSYTTQFVAEYRINIFGDIGVGIQRRKIQDNISQQFLPENNKNRLFEISR